MSEYECDARLSVDGDDLGECVQKLADLELHGAFGVGVRINYLLDPVGLYKQEAIEEATKGAIRDV